MFGGRWKQFCASVGHLAALIALIGGCFVVSWEAWPRIGRWHQQRLAEQFMAKIATTPDPEVKIPIRQLASLGTPALASLVEAAASERAAVAEIASQEIDLMFAACQVRLHEAANDDTANETAETMIALATALAENVERFGPTGKQWAERMAVRMIDQADRLPVATAARLLSQCSLVLESVPPQGPRLQTVRTVGAAPTQENALAVAPPSIDLQMLAAPSEQAFAAVRRQQPFAQPLESTLAPSPTEDPLSTEDLSLSGNASLSVKVLQPQTPPPPTTIIEVPTPLEMQRRLNEFRGMSTDSLLARLPRSDKFVAGAIRTALGERGMQDAELEMVARTKSPDVADRLRLVEEVSALPAASARRLLRLLLSDDSGEVRLRALTILATTNDPGLAELARAIAVRDEDPRVAELASRLLRQ
ncbi:MAG: hypothetical protein IH898_13165 [Planctomycetes bacterium]|nr:hypothetical protein [Planctomycetota bacterium]